MSLDATEPRRTSLIARPDTFVDWRAVFAGAVIAAGVSITLLAFGSAIGLSVSSTAPTWRDSSSWLWLLSGLFLLFVALCGFGSGGYATGRMRSPTGLAETVESEFQDGMHGLIAWGLAILLTAVLALAGAALASRATAPSGGVLGPSASVAGENVIATELDELFRTDQRVIDSDIVYRRAEAARILLKTSGNRGVADEDRAYLAAIAAREAGISAAEARDRTDRVVAESATEIHRARVAAVLQAFMIAAALMAGAAVSWFSAAEGGSERERGAIPIWDWTLRRRTRPKAIV
ncbi:MAG TPA: hypothetical protein VGJ08_09800 [Rhizomicrobium sp.]|jgi:hypothetical protein